MAEGMVLRLLDSESCVTIKLSLVTNPEKNEPIEVEENWTK